MTKFDRFTEAYKEMASWARYQPASPGDGFRSVSLTTDEPVSSRPRCQKSRAPAMSFDPERCKRLLELIEHLPDDVKCEIKERLNPTPKNTPSQEEPPVPCGSLLYVPSVGTASGHLSRYRNGSRIHANESTWPGGWYACTDQGRLICGSWREYFANGGFFLPLRSRVRSQMMRTSIAEMIHYKCENY